VTVEGITFLRNCGSYTIGALRIAAPSGGTTTVGGCRFLSVTNSGIGLQVIAGDNTTIFNCTVLGKTNGSAYDGDGINISGVTGTTLMYSNTIAGNYVGDGADITASAYLYVTNNVFQTNYYDGLYFDPSSTTKTAVVAVSNNVFSVNGSAGNYYGALLENFGTLNLAGNIFNGNYGGGAFVYYSLTAAVVGNTFYQNGVYNGYYGGLGVNNLSSAIVTGNTFIRNAGGYGGGGAYFYTITTNTVTGNTFNGNSTYSGSGGGAVCLLSVVSGNVVTVSNNTFSANSVDGPGGALSFIGSGVDVVANNTFTGNSSTGNYGGGAAYFSGGTNYITANTFQQNSSADGGGAIYAASPGYVNFSDNLLANNSQSGAGATGGGIFVSPASALYMINNTIFNNTSGGGGGGASFQIGSTQLLYVFNNIIWGNSTTGNGADVYLTGSGQSTELQYNDVNGMYGVWDNALPLTNASPSFVDPVNGDYHLQTNSPCLNIGTNGTFLTLTDLDGNTRTNHAGQVDLGCYEFNNKAAHPADTNASFVITPGEYNTYAAAWKAGQPWSIGTNTGPNPIPIPANYVTRAGYLMTNGGSYFNNGSARPTNWQTNAP